MNERTELSDGDLGRIYFLGELVKAPVALLEWEQQFAVSFVSEPRALDHGQRDAVEELRFKYPEVRTDEHPTSNIQHPTSNIQHPTSNIQHPMLKPGASTIHPPLSTFSYALDFHRPANAGASKLV